MINNKTKLLIAFFPFFILLLSCNKKIDTKNTQSFNAEKTIYPFTIKTEYGEVTIKEKPKRAISLTLTTDEIIFDLFSDKSEIFALSYIATNNAFSKIAGKISGNTKIVKGDNEVVLSLNPDLVIVASFVNSDIKNSISKSGAAIYTIDDIHKIEDIKNTIYNLGNIFDKKEEAINIINSMTKKLNAIKEKTKTITNKARVLYLSVNGYTAGKNTSFDEIAKYAGVYNAASELSIKGNTQMPTELLLNVQIDYIIASEYNMNEKQIVDFFQNHSIYKDINAVKKTNIIVINHKDIVSTSQYIVNGVVALYNQVYNKK